MHCGGQECHAENTVGIEVHDLTGAVCACHARHCSNPGLHHGSPHPGSHPFTHETTGHPAAPGGVRRQEALLLFAEPVVTNISPAAPAPPLPLAAPADQHQHGNIHCTCCVALQNGDGHMQQHFKAVIGCIRRLIRDHTINSNTSLTPLRGMHSNMQAQMQTSKKSMASRQYT